MKNLLNNVKNLTIIFIWLGFFPMAALSYESNNLTSCVQQHEVSNSLDNLAKEKIFREMLVKNFPNSNERVNFEKRQGKNYRTAIKKIQEFQKLYPLSSSKDYQKFLTAEEQSSLDYFQGNDFYTKFQDPLTPPNVFDTRLTFLRKMENENMREKFLETYNRENSIE